MIKPDSKVVSVKTVKLVPLWLRVLEIAPALPRLLIPGYEYEF